MLFFIWKRLKCYSFIHSHPQQVSTNALPLQHKLHFPWVVLQRFSRRLLPTQGCQVQQSMLPMHSWLKGSQGQGCPPHQDNAWVMGDDTLHIETGQCQYFVVSQLFTPSPLGHPQKRTDPIMRPPPHSCHCTTAHCLRPLSVDSVHGFMVELWP